ASRTGKNYEALPQQQRADGAVQEARPLPRPAPQAPTRIKVEAGMLMRSTSSADKEAFPSSGPALEHGPDLKTGQRGQVQRADDTVQDARPPVRPAAKAPTHIKVEVDQPIRPTSPADEEIPSSSGSALEHGLNVKTGERIQERHADSFIQDACLLTRPATQLPARLTVEVDMPLRPTSVDKEASSQPTLSASHGPEVRIAERAQGERADIAAQGACPYSSTTAPSPARLKVNVSSLSTADPRPGAELLDAFIQEQRTTGFFACPTVSGPFLSSALEQAFSGVPWSQTLLAVGYRMLLDDYATRLQALRTQRTPPIYWSLVLDSEQRIVDRLRSWISHGYLDEILRQGRDLLPLRPPYRFPAEQGGIQPQLAACPTSHSPPKHDSSGTQLQRPLTDPAAERREPDSKSKLKQQSTARHLEPRGNDHASGVLDHHRLSSTAADDSVQVAAAPAAGNVEGSVRGRTYGSLVTELWRQHWQSHGRREASDHAQQDSVMPLGAPELSSAHSPSRPARD
ncbi:hypothetical protein OC835_007977, partial [Tilletia horrida]